MPNVDFKKSVTGSVSLELYHVQTSSRQFQQLVFGSDNKTSKNITSGDRVLVFELAGAPGSTVTISIKSPAEETTRRVTIPPSGSIVAPRGVLCLSLYDWREAMRKRYYLPTLVAILLACMSPTGWADTKCATKTELGNNAVSSGSLETSFAASTGAVQIDAGTEGGTAKVRLFSSVTSEPISSRGNCSRPDYYKSRGWDLTFSAPTGKNDDSKDFATLDGLASGTNVKLTFGRSATFGAENDFSGLLERTAQALNVAHTNCVNKRELNPGLDCKKPSIDSDSNVEEYILLHAPEQMSKLRSKARMWWFKGSAQVGLDSVKYIDATDLSSEDDTELEYSLGVSVAHISVEYNTALDFGVNFESAMKESKEGVACLNAVDEADGPKCVSGKIGAPERQEAWKAYTEFRWRSAKHLYGQTSLGIAPRISYDFEEEVTGVSFPIYLVDFKKKGLTTGLNFGWLDDKDDVTVGFFVGGAFDLFGG